MSTTPIINVPHGDDVTTEPQRLALEAMSRELVEKLNAMVAEQERRAHEFAAQQHSLSSLPAFTLPEVQQGATQSVPEQPLPQPHGIKAHLPQQPPTKAPALPDVPAPRQLKKSTGWDDPWKGTTDSDSEYKMPTIIRDTSEDKKSGSIGAGTISIIIFIIFVLIMRGCE